MNIMKFMKYRRTGLISLFTVCLLTLSLLTSPASWLKAAIGTSVAASAEKNKPPVDHADNAARKALIQENYGKLPLSFEANQGQTAPRVKYLSRGAGYTFFLTANEAVMELRRADAGVTSMGSAQNSLDAYAARRTPQSAQQPAQQAAQQSATLRMKLVGANAQPRISGADELPGKSNYFLGSDAKQWQTDVPNYARVKAEGVYRGIDVIYYGNQQQLEYDFILAPGADPKAIKLSFTGAQRMRLDEQGDLILMTQVGEIRQHKPFVYQVTEQGNQEIASRYTIQGDQVSFTLGAYDTSRPLVIDPVLSYSTFLGGNATDIAEAIAIDAQGNAYVAGWTGAGGNGVSTFPITSGAIRSHQTMGANSGSYIFVTKLNADGSALIYSAIIGGTLGKPFYDSRGNLQSVLENRAKSIAVDPQGYACVVGWTRSANFPTTLGAVQTSPVAADVNEAFALRLNLTGSALVYSTLLGQGEAEATGIGVDNQGQAWVAGWTSSRIFPVTADAFQRTPKNRNYSAFVSKLNPTGTQLFYGTYLSSGSADLATAVAVDSSGNAYVTGWTGSSCNPNFPVDPFPTTEGAFRRDLGTGCVNPGTGTFIYLTRFNANGALAYSTLIGDGRGYSVAVDSTGNAYITGKTFKGVEFPTTPGAFQQEAEGTLYTEAGFVTKLNANGSALVYSTYLNGASGNPDRGPAIAVTANGEAGLTGTVSGTTFVTTTKDGPFQADRGAWVLKLDPAGSAPAYSVILGGGDSFGQGIAANTGGDVYITGATRSAQFPTSPGAFQRQLGSQENNAHDAFITKISESVTQQPQAQWTTTGSSRFSTSSFTFTHGTYTKLHNGSVIATGSSILSATEEMLRSVEIYDPLAEKWRDAEPMHFPRSRHDALLLPNGKLLVIGGFRPNASPPYVYAGPPEVFDPATGKWTILPLSGEDLAPLYTLIPSYPLPLLLPNGKVILFVGLRAIRPFLLDLSNNAVSAGPFAPQYTGGFGRGTHSASVLPNGKVLLLLSRKVLIYDPASLTWSEGNAPNNGAELSGRVTTFLPNGDPFALFSTYLTPERPNPDFFSGVFNQGTQSWQSFAPRNFEDTRGYEPYSIVLPQGDTVLTVEGNTPTLYDIKTGAWNRTSRPLGELGIPTLLADGRVLSGNQLYGTDFGNNNPLTIVNASAASYRVEGFARGSIVSVFGANLSGTVRIKDRNGVEHNVDHIFASTPNQINFLLPDTIPQGQAEMTIGTQRGLLSIVDVASGIFTANADGNGVPAATILRVNFNGTQAYEPVAQFDPATGRMVPVEIPVMGPAGDAYLVLFGTGWRNRTAEQNVTVYIGGVPASVQFVGAQGDFAGLDQMNILIPRSLAGRGDVDVLVTVNGKTANPVKLRIK